MKRKLPLLGIALICSLGLLAQAPPEPPANAGSGGGPVGGGAPLGSGLVILMALGAAYGGKKIFDFRKFR